MNTIAAIAITTVLVIAAWVITLVSIISTQC